MKKNQYHNDFMSYHVVTILQDGWDDHTKEKYTCLFGPKYGLSSPSLFSSGVGGSMV